MIAAFSLFTPSTTRLETEAVDGQVQKPFRLASGQILAPLRFTYSVTGPSSAPPIIVLGGISSHRFPGDTPEWNRDGWWPQQVGPGKVIDTEKFRVIGFDFIGSGTFPKPWQEAQIDTSDQARGLAVVLDDLGIHKVAAVVGASYGGMTALAFAKLFPERLEKLIVISAAHCNLPHALAVRSVQRDVIRLGLQTGQTESALDLARRLAMTAYRTPDDFNVRFEPGRLDEDHPRSVISYLRYQGGKFVRRFDPYAYLRLSESIDRHQVQPEAIQVPTSLIGIESDFLVPIEQMERLQSRIPAPCTLVRLKSRAGHDAFLKEETQITQTLRPILAGCC